MKNNLLLIIVLFNFATAHGSEKYDKVRKKYDDKMYGYDKYDPCDGRYSMRTRSIIEKYIRHMDKITREVESTARKSRNRK